MITLTGDKKLEAVLTRLPNNVQRNMARRAMRKALTMLKKEAKQLAPVKSGQLKKSLMTKVKMKATGEMTGKVFAKGGRVKRSAPHAHLVEWGYTHKSGRRVAGRYFMTRAFEKNKQNVIDTFRFELKKEIAKEAVR